MEAYLESMPNGVASFADHTQKVAFCRQFADDHPQLLARAAELPAEVARLVTHPEPVNAWIAEAQVNALYLGACDLLFADDDGLIDAVYKMNVRVLRGPLYRVMMMVASPKIIMRHAESRWAAFHRGVRLKAEMRGERGALVRMIYPTNLYSPLMARAYSAAFRAAIEAAGGKDVKFEMSAYGSTVATFDGSWS
jgi:hypothetical protein